MTNWTSSPTVISPARTSRAPIHRTPVTPAKIRKITSAVITARVLIRVRADRNDRSVTSANPARVRVSWVKACTVCAASRLSDAVPDELAIQSWFSRASTRRRRPSRKIGATTTGTSNNSNPVSLAEVRSSITNPPSATSTCRSASDTDEPITDRISVVSVVMRLMISPVITFSKKPGDRPITRSNTALRMSATTRSPSRVTSA